MTDPAASKWARDQVPFAYLTDEAGEYLDGPLEDTLMVKVPLLRWDAEHLVALTENPAFELVIDTRGKTLERRAPGYPRPGTKERAVIERFGLKDAVVRLDGPDGQEVGRSQTMGDSAGQYGPCSMAWSPNGKHFAVGAYRILYVSTFGDSSSTQALSASQAVISQLSFIGNDTVAFIFARTLLIWDISRGVLADQLQNNGFNRGFGLVVTPDGNELLIGGKSLTRAPLGALASAKPIDLPVITKRRIAPSITVLGFSPDGKNLLATAGNTLFVINWPDFHRIETVDLGNVEIQSAAVSSDGERLTAAGSGCVHFWRYGGAPPRAVTPPRFETRSVPALRRQLKAPATLVELEQRLRSSLLLQNLGKPEPYDDAVERMSDFSQWPGPESEEGEALALQLQTWVDATTNALDASAASTKPIQPISNLARQLADQRLEVPVAEQDDYYSPRYACLTQLELVVKQTAAFLLLGWAIPDDLQELFLLFEAGHWPSAYASSTRDAELPVKLLVL